MLEDIWNQTDLVVLNFCLERLHHVTISYDKARSYLTILLLYFYVNCLKYRFGKFSWNFTSNLLFIDDNSYLSLSYFYIWYVVWKKNLWTWRFSETRWIFYSYLIYITVNCKYYGTFQIHPKKIHKTTAVYLNLTVFFNKTIWTVLIVLIFNQIYS